MPFARISPDLIGGNRQRLASLAAFLMCFHLMEDEKNESRCLPKSAQMRLQTTWQISRRENRLTEWRFK
jgi:hypothetical protein